MANKTGNMFTIYSFVELTARPGNRTQVHFKNLAKAE